MPMLISKWFRILVAFVLHVPTCTCICRPAGRNIHSLIVSCFEKVARVSPCIALLAQESKSENYIRCRHCRRNPTVNHKTPYCEDCLKAVCVDEMRLPSQKYIRCRRCLKNPVENERVAYCSDCYVLFPLDDEGRSSSQQYIRCRHCRRNPTANSHTDRCNSCLEEEDRELESKIREKDRKLRQIERRIKELEEKEEAIRRRKYRKQE